MRTRAQAGTPAVAVTVTLLCGLTLALGYLNKARCAGAPFAENGRSLVFDRLKDSNFCFSDIQFLWLGRDIDNHVFPYLTGGITPDGFLTGGTVEYPVLSGLLMWLGGIGAPQRRRVPAELGADPGAVRARHRVDARSARGLACAAVGGRPATCPVRLPQLGAAGRRGRHRGDLRGRVLPADPAAYQGDRRRRPAGDRPVPEDLPGVFVLPLMAFVFTGGTDGSELPASVRGRFDPKGALMVAAAAAAL